MRDDFNKQTRDKLAQRVGYKCSNPGCRKATSGPRATSVESVDIGVAAHICAAAARGPRYDATMTVGQRMAADNGIWLCQNCGKLVDNDTTRYPAGVLEEWKRLAEAHALLELEGDGHASSPESSDVEIIRFFSACFDRPAFQDPFHREGSMEAFDPAMESTITALNTGSLRDRSGHLVAQGRGKSFLKRYDWRRQMDAVVDLLRAIRSRYEHAVDTGEIRLGAVHLGKRFYEITSDELAAWMDATRAEAVGLLAAVCQEAGVPMLVFPRRPLRGW